MKQRLLKMCLSSRKHSVVEIISLNFTHCEKFTNCCCYTDDEAVWKYGSRMNWPHKHFYDDFVQSTLWRNNNILLCIDNIPPMFILQFGEHLTIFLHMQAFSGASAQSLRRLYTSVAVAALICAEWCLSRCLIALKSTLSSYLSSSCLLNLVLIFVLLLCFSARLITLLSYSIVYIDIFFNKLSGLNYRIAREAASGPRSPETETAWLKLPGKRLPEMFENKWRSLCYKFRKAENLLFMKRIFYSFHLSVLRFLKLNLGNKLCKADEAGNWIL